MADISKRDLERAQAGHVSRTRVGRDLDRAQKADVKAQKADEKRLIALQWKIAQGYTTGDPVLDTAIMVFDDPSPKSEGYRRIARVLTQLQDHRGQLAKMAFQDLSVVPENPVVTTRMPNYEQSMLNGRHLSSIIIPMGEPDESGRYQREWVFVSNHVEGLLEGRDEILFGGQIQELLERLSGRAAVDLFDHASRIGHPLKETIGMVKEISRRREKRVAELVPLAADLKVKMEALRSIKSIQGHRLAEEIGKYVHPEVEQAPGGLLVKFQEYEYAERSAQALERALKQCDGLGLEDNGSFKWAVRLVAEYREVPQVPADDDIPF